MLSTYCFHNENTCISSSICVANNVEEIQDSMEQDVDVSGASSNISSSSTTSHFCLMAKASKVIPTLNPNVSNDDDAVNYDALLMEKG